MMKEFFCDPWKDRNDPMMVKKVRNLITWEKCSIMNFAGFKIKIVWKDYEHPRSLKCLKRSLLDFYRILSSLHVGIEKIWNIAIFIETSPYVGLFRVFENSYHYFGTPKPLIHENSSDSETWSIFYKICEILFFAEPWWDVFLPTFLKFCGQFYVKIFQAN